MQSSPSGTGNPMIPELLRLEDEDFVRAAYRRLLERPAAAEELPLWLDRLREGRMTKLEVLAGIRYSPEGRARGVRAPGLVMPRVASLVRRVPLVGYATRWIQQLATLPGLARRLNALEAAREVSQTTDLQHARRLSELEAEAAANANSRAQHEAAIDGLTSLADALASEVHRLATVKADLSYARDVDARTQALATWVTPVDALRDVAASRPSRAEAPSDADSFDAYYRRFEERFRGSPEQIRERLSFYVPMLQAAATACAPAGVVDLGCGRGEMVQLLCERGLRAYGVDSSEAMAERCRELGLPVVHADAVEHLRSLDPESLAGVTSIHVIEHLPFRLLMNLFACAFRALCPGGVAIFETPNPENLIVGACNFYYDPTHIRPLPPEPMRFLLESGGFERVAIERLHPGAAPAADDAGSDPVARVYSAVMLVPQDYALIAYKPLRSATAAA